MTDDTRPAKAAYHHGNLRAELLRAARDLLERHGVAGVTLRAAARSAGVSHAAPQHHFGDLTGLLSDLAAEGFHEMVAELEAAATRADGPDELAALGYAYVAYAAEHPAMFLLMFRSEALDLTRPSLSLAIRLSRDVLARGAAGQRDPASEREYSRAVRGRVVRAWAMVHGFAMLLLDGRLTLALAAVGGDWRVLLDEAFDPDQKREARKPGASAVKREKTLKRRTKPEAAKLGGAKSGGAKSGEGSRKKGAAIKP